MPRPCKRRRICGLPGTTAWIPSEDATDTTAGVSAGSQEPEILLLEEYETLRLIDWMGMTQEECAAQMGVARTTVQAVYGSARRKLAGCLVCGRPFCIAGGEYVVCSAGRQCGWSSGRCMPRCGRALTDSEIQQERGMNMKVAVTYENGQVFQHFGHTEQFKIYEIEGQTIKSSEIVDTNGSGHGALSGFLAGHQVQALICGGIGGGARTALAEAGIELYPGVTGDADACVQAFASGSLKFDPDTVCSHHHEDGHDCGEDKHGCGGH